jgi:hypothetical protein
VFSARDFREHLWALVAQLLHGCDVLVVGVANIIIKMQIISPPAKLAHPLVRVRDLLADCGRTNHQNGIGPRVSFKYFDFQNRRKHQ